MVNRIAAAASVRLVSTFVITAALCAPASHADTIRCGDLAGWGDSTPTTPDGRLRTGTPCFERLEPANGGLLLAEADSDRGVVRAAATVELPAGVSHVAEGSSGWWENFWVINHPDSLKQGTNGLLRFSFFIQGTLDATGAGFASVVLQATDRNGLLNIFSASASSVTGPRVIEALVEGTISFVFGQSSNFQFVLTTRAQRFTGMAGAGFAEALFNNSGYWGGITAVEDGDGILEGFTFGGADINFESAFKTSTIPAPVPLPASVWLLGTGVAGLLWRRRAKAAAA